MDNSKLNGEKSVRKSCDYPPSSWGNLFIAYSPAMQDSEGCIKKRIEELKEELRNMLKSTMNVAEMMNLIDTIQHLGVDYHFEREVDDALTCLSTTKFESDDLYEVALHFRLLRQHGFHVLADIFLKFKEKNGSFLETLSGDARGLLSLYNAAYLGIPGEQILDEAISFARGHLKAEVDNLKSPLKNQVVRALKTPLPRMMKRLEARWFIDEYQEEDLPNVVLLELAKLDFNMVQSLHYEELKTLSLWWKDLNLVEKLRYARDRMVEGYFWVSGVYFEPQFSRARILMTKVFAMIVLLDDTYDVYATFEECRLLTDAIERWDKEAAHSLPESLRYFYITLVNLPKELEYFLQPSEKHRASYVIEHFKRLVNAYMREAEWLAKGYTPTCDERLEAALESSTVFMLNCISFIGMGEIATKDIFIWANNKPDVFRACAMFCRFTDDVVGYKREHENGEVASMVDCYMKEHKATKEEAIAKVRAWADNAWTKMNQAFLRPTEVSVVLIERVVNLAVMTEVIYNYFGDGFTECYNLKDCITSLFLKPVSI